MDIAAPGSSGDAGGHRDPQLHVGWWSRQGLFLHATMLVVVSGCTIATWWQLSRALAGNGLSWAYTFEWPCFAVYALVLWWRLIHEPPPLPASTPSEAAGPAAPVGDVRVASATLDEVARAAVQGDWHP